MIPRDAYRTLSLLSEPLYFDVFFTIARDRRKDARHNTRDLVRLLSDFIEGYNSMEQDNIHIARP